MSETKNLKGDVSPLAPIDLFDGAVDENAERQRLIYEIACYNCGHRTLVSPAIFGLMGGKCPNLLCRI